MRSIPTLLCTVLVLSVACGGGGDDDDGGSAAGVPLDGLQASSQPHYAPGAAAVFTLADGSTLVMGGPPTSKRDKKLSQLYHPSTDQWSQLPPSTFDPPARATVQLDDGRIMAINGFEHSSRPSEGDEERVKSWRPDPFTEIFDPSTATWSKGTPPPTASATDRAAVLPGGDILLFGCHNGEAHMARYSPSSDAWTALDAGTINGKMCNYQMMAQTTAGPVLADRGKAPVYTFDEKAQTWSEVANKVATTSAIVGLPGGKALVVPFSSPTSEEPVAAVLDVAAGTWSETSKLPKAADPRWRPGAVAVADGSATILGGSVGAPSKCDDGIRVLDLDALTWTMAGTLASARAPSLAISGADGSLLAVGGKTANDGGQCRKSAEDAEKVPKP